jgi:hypothetical protein
MAFVLLFIGMVLLIVGVRGEQDAFNRLMLDLFTGPNNLTFWALAILMVGALGYIKPLRGFAIAFMTLILLSLLVGNQKFFERLFEQIKAGTSGPTTELNLLKILP